MRQHTFYPRVIATVPSRRRQAARFLRWLAVCMVLTLMVIGAATVIAQLASIDAQLDGAYMQGMQAGTQLCRSGV